MAALQSNRFDWIDWMKAIGIYLIVLCHFYSVGEKFLYVFNVPVFFIISGFLNKREDDCRLFWKKLWFNLAIPMLIMATLNVLFHSVQQLLRGVFNPMDIYWFVRNIAFFMVAGVDSLWFVYTLIFLKIIFQYSYSDKVFYAITAVMLALTYGYNRYDTSALPFFLSQASTLVDVCISFPFFALGYFARGYRDVLNSWDHKIGHVMIAIAAFFLTAVCWRNNGDVGLYCCDYGGNMLLYLVGGTTGSIMVYAIAKLYGHVPSIVAVIARGTIVILGFHKLLIALVRDWFTESYLDVVFAVLIVLLFVPVIILTEKYFPLMIGLYRINKK